MAEVLQFNTPCGAMTSVEISPKAFERTKGFAEGAVFGCRECNAQCTLWQIAKVQSHEELIALLETSAILMEQLGDSLSNKLSE